MKGPPGPIEELGFILRVVGYHSVVLCRGVNDRICMSEDHFGHSIEK